MKDLILGYFSERMTDRRQRCPLSMKTSYCDMTYFSNLSERKFQMKSTRFPSSSVCFSVKGTFIKDVI